MSEVDLSNRVEAIQRVVEQDNPDLYRYNIEQVDDLLSKLNYTDLNHQELVTIGLALAEAYGRKLRGSGDPTLRAVPHTPHGPSRADMTLHVLAG